MDLDHGVSFTHAFTKSRKACAKPVVQKCTVKKVFLKISKNSQENTCARVSFLIKLHKISCPRLATLLKKRLWRKCFPVNSAKFLQTLFL